MRVRFGAVLHQSAARPQDVVGLAELVGLDVVALSDHPYWPHRLDTVTLLSTIVARTRRVTVLSNPMNLPLRPPAVPARTAASLDILSGGRFELGLGSGRRSASGSARTDRACSGWSARSATAGSRARRSCRRRPCRRPTASDDPEFIRRFADEVAPAVRDLVAKA
ncbi:LLM class flavin-dependent oxidoreductase [Kutzneria buriramensis]|uniref:Luciferase-like monooxygenase n=1 Tax=Kutzneria buriramensis TaxID=1045776 RepID=A0A3E0HER1_9PSEU|nr:LLM class flavin-dependent oxidoreductase [Kutzneria buriramensis]REH43536.1 luciferase-like monooxygenase [Kutzneria buriramensis]